ncbi:phage baseplate plug family protein [Treponema sp. R6D11]
MLVINFDSSVGWDQRASVQLENKMVNLRIQWNEVASYAFMDIEVYEKNDEVQKRTGIKLVPNWHLLHNTGYHKLKGELFLLRTINERPAEFEYIMLGREYCLYYFTPEEYNQWRRKNGFSS